jgi:hypothetical protein
VAVKVIKEMKWRCHKQLYITAILETNPITML